MSSPSGGDPPTAQDAFTIIKALSIAEKKRLFRALESYSALTEGTGFVVIPKDILDLFMRHQHELVDMLEGSHKLLTDYGNQLTRRNAKPRKADRDDEIVRLRDEEGKTFGEIPRLLMQRNPAWCSKDGKLMTRDAVERAYARRKSKGTK